jgi:uncharacterized protein (DUF433 family)
MIEDYNAGMTFEEIEDKYCRSNRLRAHLKAAGLVARPGGPRNSKEKRAGVWADYKAGMSVDKIRQKYGYSQKSQIYVMLKNLREEHDEPHN